MMTAVCMKLHSKVKLQPYLSAPSQQVLTPTLRVAEPFCHLSAQSVDILRNRVA